MTLQNADESMPDLSMVNSILWATYRDKAGLINGELYACKNTLQNTTLPREGEGNHTSDAQSLKVLM